MTSKGIFSPSRLGLGLLKSCHHDFGNGKSNNAKAFNICFLA